MSDVERQFWPTIEMGRVARQISHEQPQRIETVQRLFDNRLREHYTRTGIMQRDPQYALFSVYRAQVSAFMAPFILATEQKLADHITAQRKAGNPLILPQYSQEIWADRRLTNNGRQTFEGKKLVFLRASSLLVNQAFLNVWGDMNNRGAHWLKPIWQAYCQAEAGLVYQPYRENYVLHYRARSDPFTRLTDQLIASSRAVLSTIIPAAEHARHAQLGKNIGEVLLRQVWQLSWAATTSIKFFGRHFPEQTTARTPKTECQFEHDAALIASRGSIWKPKQLQKGPLPIPSYCPAGIRLDVSDFCATAAELRLRSGIQIAEEIFGPDFQTIIKTHKYSAYDRHSKAKHDGREMIETKLFDE